MVLLDRDVEALDRLAEIGAGTLRAVAVDLANPSAIAMAAEAVLDMVGHVDILVNNAGVLSPHKLAATTLGDWRDLMAVNLDAAMLLSQAFVPGMKACGWGRLVNISSYAWKSGGLTAGTAYAVSKAALVGLAFSAARELAGAGITSNALAPAYVVSPMVTEQLSDDERKGQLAAIPVGRFCRPEEVAHAVAFLASPLSGFITGCVIDMNGGMQFG